MWKNNIIKRALFIIMLLMILVNTHAQTGLNFQGVARTSNNVILASQAITIKLSILQGSSTGTADYVETRRVITNAQGLFTAVIGDTGAISSLGNFTNINWKNTPKFLKIEMDAAAGTNFITMGTTQFQYVAYAQFAKSVDAENIVGIVPVTLGGTGVNSLTGLKTALNLNNVNNTTDLTKPISTLTQTALDLKLNAADTSKYTKQTYSDSALLTKLSIAGTASSATKLATARNINGVAFDGSGDITITAVADAGTLTGTTLKSTVTGSSLTSVGTLANLTVTNPIVGSITGNAATATTATTAGTATTTTGNAGSATKLATARNINGVAFDGSGDITITAVADAGTLTGTTLKSTVTGSSLTSVGTLANLTVTNPIVGSITGNAATATTATTAGTATTTTGNAGSATKLATARNINGVAFDGSGDITITAVADAGTLTGTTLKSTITGSSLTSVGTIASLTTGAITNSGKVIVGASSAASASAVLEASSTTQGFLPPRMTKAQRDVIDSPTAGLMIWCSDNFGGEIEVYNGSIWVNMNGFSNSTLSIGDYYQGGIIAYILQAGDPGYDATTPHGLIAATSDQSTGIGIRWHNGTSTPTGATGTEIGTGLSNTNTIIASQGGTTTSYAAGLARAYRGGGYTDWYLPSIDELAKVNGLKSQGIGNLEYYYYWSSSEYSTNYAWVQNFSTGLQSYSGKVNTGYVRAIRAF
jgi:hypothetical protein